MQSNRSDTAQPAGRTRRPWRTLELDRGAAIPRVRSRRAVQVQRWLAPLLSVLVALALRAWLITTDAFEFVSDEAVVGLMARHINQGKPIPVFYYGQHYIASLDALFVAAGFRLLGESVDTIRIVQLILYLVGLAAGYALAQTVTHSRRVARVTLLLLAVPTTLGTLYTSVALGPWTELFVLTSLVLLLSWQVTVGGQQQAWRWLLLGLAAGVGWWVHGAIVTPMLVVALLGLRSFSPRHWRGYGLALVGFFVGSAPWWWYNLQHNWAALKFLFEGYGPAPGEDPTTPLESLLALLVLGLPALYGLRYPWDPGFVVTLATVLAAGVYLILIADLLAGWLGRVRGDPVPETDPPHLRPARRWVGLIFGVFTAVFVLSSFTDATGRYLMPLWTPAAMGIALGLERLRRAGWALPAAALGLLLTMQATTVIQAAHSDTGLTQQLVERLRVPSRYDQPLLDFLETQGLTRGYASYWTSFRLMFLSHEAVLFDTSLPYNEKGYQPRDNRYPPYEDVVRGADEVVWITQHFPALDRVIEERFGAARVAYQTRDFGPYHVYYGLSRPVSPYELGLGEAEVAGQLDG